MRRNHQGNLSQEAVEGSEQIKSGEQKKKGKRGGGTGWVVRGEKRKADHRWIKSEHTHMPTHSHTCTRTHTHIEFNVHIHI